MVTFIAIQLIVLLLLVICSGFFSSTETAYFSLNPVQIKRLEAEHPAAALRIQHTMAAPTRLLSTILIGNTVVNIAAASLGYELAERFVPSRGEVVAVPVVTLLLLIFGEIGPKRLAMLWPERLAAAYARILPAVSLVLAPARVLLERTTRGLEPSSTWRSPRIPAWKRSGRADIVIFPSIAGKRTGSRGSWMHGTTRWIPPATWQGR